MLPSPVFLCSEAVRCPNSCKPYASAVIPCSAAHGVALAKYGEDNELAEVERHGGAMETTNALMRITEQPALDRIAEPLSRAVRGVYEEAGPVGQQAKNAMHGVWLGHPLHPVFTDVPIGAWTTAVALDASA